MSGWEEEGVVFLIGTLTPGYMYAGIDGAIHLAEEAANATEAVPRALLCTWLIGFVTSFIIAVTAMYTTQDFSAVASTVTGYVNCDCFPSRDWCLQDSKVPGFRAFQPGYAFGCSSRGLRIILSCSSSSGSCWVSAGKVSFPPAVYDRHRS
jgi:amino acid transporter